MLNPMVEPGQDRQCCE